MSKLQDLIALGPEEEARRLWEAAGGAMDRADTPDPEVDVLRDAISEAKALQFTELLDLLSQETLACIGPRLHRGWEDRRYSCRRSRATAQQHVGVTLDEPTRERLLTLSAYRNRIFRYPPPVRVRTVPLLSALPALRELMTALLGS